MQILFGIPIKSVWLRKLNEFKICCLVFVSSEYSRHYCYKSNEQSPASLTCTLQINIQDKIFILYHGHFNIREDYLPEPFKHTLRTEYNVLRQRIPQRAQTLFPSSITYWSRLLLSTVNCETVQSITDQIQDLEFVYTCKAHVVFTSGDKKSSC